MQAPKVSIIIPVHNEAHRLEETVQAVREAADVPYEIVIVDDACTDGCTQFIVEQPCQDVRLLRSQIPLGVAAARNQGFRQAHASIVMFMDGHCYPERGFLSHLTQALLLLGRGMVVPQVTAQGDPSARGFGVTIESVNLMPRWLPAQFSDPYPVPAGCGCCQMFFKSWFEQIGCYEKMRRYGVEDLEISVRTWLLGGPVHVVPKAVVAHHFRSQTTCHVSWSDVVYNSLRMAQLHFSGEALERITAYWRSYAAYPEAEKWLEESDHRERRAWLDQRRRHSAGWYCAKFAIGI